MGAGTELGPPAWSCDDPAGTLEPGLLPERWGTLGLSCPGTTGSPLAKSPFGRRAEVQGPLSQPRPSREARPASAGKLCPGESLKSIFSARHPSPLRLRGGRAEGGVGRGEPRPRRRVCRVGLGPAPSRALRLCASGSPGAPRRPGVARQHGPGSGAAADRQKAREDGGQEEHGEAAGFGPPPAPGRRGACEPGVPGARAGPAPGRRVRDAGARGRRGWRTTQRPLGTAGIHGVGVCRAQGAGQGRAGPTDEACAHPSGLVGFGGPG